MATARASVCCAGAEDALIARILRPEDQECRGCRARRTRTHWVCGRRSPLSEAVRGETNRQADAGEPPGRPIVEAPVRARGVRAHRPCLSARERSAPDA